MRYKALLWVVPMLLILLGGGVWAGYALLNTANEVDTVAEDTRPSVTKGKADMSNEVVNKPISDETVLFEDNSLYKNGHDFIQYFHNFYNETLGWGRISSANYEEQKKKAEAIVLAINQIRKIENAELTEDFENILVLAEKVAVKDDREAMRKLHRYFHDLDIYFNGYDYQETFQVTSFKGL